MSKRILKNPRHFLRTLPETLVSLSFKETLRLPDPSWQVVSNFFSCSLVLFRNKTSPLSAIDFQLFTAILSWGKTPLNFPSNSQKFELQEISGFHSRDSQLEISMQNFKIGKSSSRILDNGYSVCLASWTLLCWSVVGNWHMLLLLMNVGSPYPSFLT